MKPLQIITVLSLPILVNSENEFGWIDPETPLSARSTKAMGNRDLTLVFSDEFNDEHRSFQDGSDTRWTAEDRPAVVNAALQYYNSSHITTRNGLLSIETTRSDAHWTEYDPNNGQRYHFSRKYQSGMLTTWNKFCFTSGMIEISFQLPGKPFEGGLWPAFWVRKSFRVPIDFILPLQQSTQAVMLSSLSFLCS
jgi:beta-glucanase (GH16 family)